MGSPAHNRSDRSGQQLTRNTVGKPMTTPLFAPETEPDDRADFSSTPASSLCFTHFALDAFREASRDFNPLHRDPAYARQTPFGEPVVFGMLGALALLSRLPMPCPRRIGTLSVEFSGAMLVDQELVWGWDDGGDGRWVGSLSDGGRVLLTLVVWEAEGDRRTGFPFGGGESANSEATYRDSSDFTEPLAVRGRYGVTPNGWDALRCALGVGLDKVDPDVASVLLWSSWLVGMELPGRQALFQGFQCTFSPRRGGPGSPFDFDARTVRYDNRFGLLRGCFELTDGGTAWGRGEFRSFVRRPSDPASDPLLTSLLGTGKPLTGRTALVIGASRGLGALTARALLLSGATVYGSYLRSAEQFDRIREQAGACGKRLVGLPGDGGDGRWCAEAVERICAERGGLDLLVCNASPAILPMRYERESAVRIHEYVAYSLALASHPVAASLPRLAESGGQVVVVSSVYAQSAPAQFPHYVAAKSAIEGLLRSVAACHTSVGFTIVRPPRLEGELNIPFAGENPLPAAVVAAGIARAAAEKPTRGVVRWLDQFPLQAA